VSEVFGNPTEVTAINFGGEGKLSLLSFERKLNEPLEDLKFYSAALMETSTHIKLLDLLGSIVLDEEMRPNTEAPPVSSPAA
jgi:hypothetical protein